MKIIEYHEVWKDGNVEISIVAHPAPPSKEWLAELARRNRANKVQRPASERPRSRKKRAA